MNQISNDSNIKRAHSSFYITKIVATNSFVYLLPLTFHRSNVSINFTLREWEYENNCFSHELIILRTILHQQVQWIDVLMISLKKKLSK